MNHEEEAWSLIEDLDLGDISLLAVGQLFRGGITISCPYYFPFRSGKIEVEFACKNDWNKNLAAFDALLATTDHSQSSGLARVVRFESHEDFASFMNRLSMLLLAGYHAFRAGYQGR